MTMRIEVATPEHLDCFKSWLNQDRLELMTCRPVVNGQRVPPSDEVVSYAFLVAERSEPVGKFAYLYDSLASGSPFFITGR